MAQQQLKKDSAVTDYVWFLSLKICNNNGSFTFIFLFFTDYGYYICNNNLVLVECLDL